jgi:hypothetical protein
MKVCGANTVVTPIFRAHVEGEFEPWELHTLHELGRSSISEGMYENVTLETLEDGLQLGLDR